MKKVTVLIPVYNGAEHIEPCLKSILHQSYSDYKVLVVNDGSKDNTLEVLKKYPVEVLSYEENKGISYALNTGIAHIDSEYIMRMDADDIAHYDRVRIQVDFMEKNPGVFMCGTTVIENRNLTNTHWEVAFGSKKITTVNELRLFYLYHTYLLHPTLIFRTKPWKEKGYWYDSRFDGVEDFELHRRVIMEEAVYQLHLPLVALTKRNNSASSVGNEKTLQRLYLAHQHFYGNFQIEGEILKLLGKGLFPRIYGTTKAELQAIEKFTYQLLEKDYFKQRIREDIIKGLFQFLYSEIEAR